MNDRINPQHIVADSTESRPSWGDLSACEKRRVSSRRLNNWPQSVKRAGSLQSYDNEYGGVVREWVRRRQAKVGEKLGGKSDVCGVKFATERASPGF